MTIGKASISPAALPASRWEEGSAENGSRALSLKAALTGEIMGANPTREEIEQSTMLSMFRVETHNFKFDLSFYPFPFRTKNGAIMFPANVKGVYTRDDVVAAFKWFDEFDRQGRLCNRLIHPEGPEIRVIEAMFFVPATDEKPFAFVQELFDLRASIIAENKNDVRGSSSSWRSTRFMASWRRASGARDNLRRGFALDGRRDYRRDKAQADRGSIDRARLDRLLRHGRHCLDLAARCLRPAVQDVGTLGA
jgi:hypothetical protein